MHADQTRNLVDEFYTCLTTGNCSTPTSSGLRLSRSRETLSAVARPSPTNWAAQPFAGGFKKTLSHKTLANVHADGGTAFAQTSIQAVTTDGAVYESDNLWIYTCRGGQITRIREHLDTLSAATAFRLAAVMPPTIDYFKAAHLPRKSVA